MSDDTDFRIASIRFDPIPHIEIRPTDEPYMDDNEFVVVDKHGYRLNKRGEWEQDPGPGGRSLAFLSRCRFGTLDDAMNAVRRFYRDVYSVGRAPSE